jgi:hypothetical protein
MSPSKQVQLTTFYFCGFDPKYYLIYSKDDYETFERYHKFTMDFPHYDDALAYATAINCSAMGLIKPPS